MNNIPFLTYLQRYWLLIVAAAAFIAAMLNDHLFQRLGPIIFIPAVACVCILTSLLIQHLFFRETIDKDIHGGRFVEEWQQLTPERRITLTVVVIVGIWIGLAIIGAGVGK